MSINVYLKDEVIKLPGYICKPWGHKGQSGENHIISGVTLLRDKGRWYIMLHEPTDQVPEAVADLVEEISFYEWIPSSPKREAGIYRHETAEAEVQPYLDGKNNRNQVRIKAKKMEDILNLFRMIKIGSIRPEESYEGQQSGMSRAELEKENEGLRDRADAFRDMFHLEAMKNESLRHFARVLNGEFWSFCTKIRVVRMINEVLDSK